MTLPTLYSFLPSSRSICALPNWENPKLLFPAMTLRERWIRSALYPAFKVRGRLYRFALRLRVALFPAPRSVEDRDSGWELQEFVSDVLPNFESATVLVGTPGPAQKVTVELRDAAGEILAYGKYAEIPAARARLQREHEVLEQLPAGVAPAAVKFGSVGNGEMLVVEPLSGEKVGAMLPPDPGITEYVQLLIAEESFSIHEHPWIVKMLEVEPRISELLTPLEGHSWPSAIRHGDFAPWNLRRKDGRVCAFDWEYGERDGFPYLDLAFYVLQTSALVRNLAPAKALADTVSFLASGVLSEIGVDGCRSIAKLAALDAYLLAKEDGHPDSSGLQQWRRQLLEGVV